MIKILVYDYGKIFFYEFSRISDQFKELKQLLNVHGEHEIVEIVTDSDIESQTYVELNEEELVERINEDLLGTDCNIIFFVQLNSIRRYW